ncbi:hypothetical protein AB0F30_19950 [Streptomyces sp. NPDC029006]|uniref:hypothetical protein n=1 Tax=Streptomyces sp. NPDC029006 TaxID=3155467 RepID=UPI0033DC5BA3
MRDLLVEYIRRRSAGLDYSTLRQLTNILVRTFWKQIEKINPDQKDLRLSEETFTQWKEWLIHLPRDENYAFWQWAIVETLRLAGLRAEELTELTHLSVRQYRRPNGEVVARLVISPSKATASVSPDPPPNSSTSSSKSSADTATSTAPSRSASATTRTRRSGASHCPTCSRTSTAAPSAACPPPSGATSGGLATNSRSRPQTSRA